MMGVNCELTDSGQQSHRFTNPPARVFQSGGQEGISLIEGWTYMSHCITWLLLSPSVHRIRCSLTVLHLALPRERCHFASLFQGSPAHAKLLDTVGSQLVAMHAKPRRLRKFTHHKQTSHPWEVGGGGYITPCSPPHALSCGAIYTASQGTVTLSDTAGSRFLTLALTPSPSTLALTVSLTASSNLGHISPLPGSAPHPPPLPAPAANQIQSYITKTIR